MRALSIPGRAWMLIGMAWLIWALLSAGELATQMWYVHRPVGITQALLARLPLAVVLAVSTPGILLLSRRMPVIAAARSWRWLVHIPACVGLIAVIDALACALTSWMTNIPFDLGSPRQYLFRVVAFWLLPVGLLYWLVVVIDHAVRQFVRAREQAELAARLSAQVSGARLEALKLRLHPHFLYNALHSIGTLVRTGRGSEAVKITALLGGLLRRLLDDAPRQEIPLRDELAFVGDYLSIELIRFSDRLQVRYDIDQRVELALVPHLVLQPLVENALKHGLQACADGGCLTISARRAGGRVELRVADDGVGYGVSSTIGTGLTTTRARLAELYRDDCLLDVRRLEPSGTEVLVSLPLRMSPVQIAAAS
jgi:two-component system, LytTR family, sensor kinase